MSQIWLPCQIFSCCTTDLAAVHRFGCNATDLSTLPQIYRLCDRFGHSATHLATMPQIWPLCHRFGRCAADLATVPQIWPPCHRFGPCAIYLDAVPHIWLPCNRFGRHATYLVAVPQNANETFRKYGCSPTFISVLQVISVPCMAFLNEANP